ncbi:YceI family protein [Flavobacterium silvaticum]|uniref:YceI family protein n=1 Tax=Flavobacterium silvaticum TaxID=1852020 RepID=A0A972JHN2_9FLAO|nr:YceI family protein [Flavobacterium silvaticum]NMH29411.1 YceI family protein [Flavobacterium silvaticum]
MKNMIIALICGFSVLASAQKISTRSGQVNFEASMPAFEEIAAKNNTASAVLETDSGNFASLVLIKGFKFKVPLMEEHFNENYMESDKFPKATIKGTIKNFDKSKIGSAPVLFDFEGDLTIHGITKKLKTKVQLSSASGKTKLTSDFKIKPADFNIEIPSVVKSKVAENVSVLATFVLE